MRNTLVVNLYGGPGCGKSTTAAGVFSLLKLHGITCEMALEYAKDLVWEDRTKTLSNQAYVFGKQYNRIYKLLGKVDVVITDSPLLLSVLYKPGHYKSSFDKFVLSIVDGMSNLHVVIERVKEYCQVGRIQTASEAADIDFGVKAILEEHCFKYLKIQGNCDGINTLSNALLYRLGGMEPKYKLTLC